MSKYTEMILMKKIITRPRFMAIPSPTIGQMNHMHVTPANAAKAYMSLRKITGTRCARISLSIPPTAVITATKTNCTKV